MTKDAGGIVITGAKGQLGQELIRCCPDTVQCVPIAHCDLDITDAAAVRALITHYQPDAIINCAAYTAVDLAEQNAALATSVNAIGPGLLASEARRNRCYLIHISTDFVFDGIHGRPYRPSDDPAPRGVYAYSKREGERAVQANLPSAMILRTAWLYSIYGTNFVKTILRCARERSELRVVDDQIGTPTWARGLAYAVWRALARRLCGIHHWTDAGVASRYDFAVAITEEALALKLLEQAPRITPMRTADYLAASPRPKYSVLEKTVTWSQLELIPPHWRVQLRAMLRELACAREAIGDA